MNRYKVAVACLVLALLASGAAGLEWHLACQGPAPRCASRMIYDSAGARIIMFGGTTVFTNGRYYNDVWQVLSDEYGYSGWLPLIPKGTPPSGRADCAMFVDPPGNRAILFAGSPGYGQQLNDVWALDLTPGSENWKQLTPSGTPPSARAYPITAYHPTRRSLIVFGGYTRSGAVDDVWELKLDPLEWRQLRPSGPGPSARYDGAAVLVPSEDRMLVFGGKAGGTFFGDLWELSREGSEGVKWTELSPSGTGPERLAGEACTQTVDGSKLFLFGGWDPGGTLDDLYELDVPSLTWYKLSPSGEIPEPRRNTCGAWDGSEGNFFIYGGELSHGDYLCDIWYIDLEATGVVDAPTWQKTSSVVNPALFISVVAVRSVVINYQVPLLEQVQVDMLDVNGRVVRRLYSGKPEASSGRLTWDGQDSDGARAAAGTYFCRLTVGATTVSRRFVLLD